MDLESAARRAGSLLAGDDTVERTAALALAATVGTSFGPGLLPRPGLDQALATGIVAADEPRAGDDVAIGVCGAGPEVRRRRRDTGGPGAELSPPRRRSAQASRWLVPAWSACCPRGPVSRCAGRRCGRSAGGGSASGWPGRRWPASRPRTRPWVGAGRACGCSRPGAACWPAPRSPGGRSTGTTRARRLTRPGSAPATDPLTGQASGEETAPEPLPLPPVPRSLLLGAAVSVGLHGVALAEGVFARGLAAGIRRVAPGAAPHRRAGGPRRGARG